MMLRRRRRAIVGSINLAPGGFGGRRELAIETDHPKPPCSGWQQTAQRDWASSHKIDLGDAGLLHDLEKRQLDPEPPGARRQRRRRRAAGDDGQEAPQGRGSTGPFSARRYVRGHTWPPGGSYRVAASGNRSPRQREGNVVGTLLAAMMASSVIPHGVQAPVSCLKKVAAGGTGRHGRRAAQPPMR